MDHREYSEILKQRLVEEPSVVSPEKMEIHVVYTSDSLVQAGQQLMRDSKQSGINQQPRVIGFR